MSAHFRFGATDGITIRGIAYRWINSIGHSHVLERLDHPGTHETFTDARLAEEAGRQDWDFVPKALAKGRAVAKARSGVDTFADIPIDEQPEVMWRLSWCENAERLFDSGEAARTDDGIQAKLKEMTTSVIEEAVAALERSPSGRQARCGTPFTGFKNPSPRNLRRWIKTLRDADGDPTALRKGYHRCGDRSDRFEAEIEALLDKHAWEWANENRPPKSVCYDNLSAAVAALNQEREADGQAPFACPSYKAFQAHIKELPAFDVHAARHGPEAARRKFQALGEGLDVTRAGERVEMDEWEVQLKTLLVKFRIWKRLPAETRAAIEKVRVWICFAIDAASRCILAFTVSRTPNAENACAALQMIMRDKQAYADAVGAKSRWDMACTPETVVTDAGSSFVAAEFKSKAIAILASPHTVVAGRPKLRARIERLFSTVHLRLIARFLGRTFSKVVDKGDYDPEARAALTVDMLCEALVRWIVDIYHNTPHRGLAMATPGNTWAKLVDAYGVAPPPGPNRLRHVFGIEGTRTTGPHGVRVLGLDYRGDALHAHRHDHGETEVRIKIDPLDLGHVSVEPDGRWHTLPCKTPRFGGVSVDEWTAAFVDLRRRNLADAKPSLPIVHDAIRAIQAIGERGIEAFGLGLTRPSAEQIEGLERDLFIGVVMPTSDDDAPEEPAERPDLFAKAVQGTGPLSPTWLEERGIEPPPAPPSPDPEELASEPAAEQPPEAETTPRTPPPAWSIDYD